MTRQRRATTARKEPETVVEPSQNALYPKGGGTRSRKFDCQRNTIEATTNASDRGRHVRVRRDILRGRACPLAKQPDGTVAMRVIKGATFWGDSERRHQISPFAIYPEWLAAGGDHARCRVGAQQRFGHLRRCMDHMFAVVEHEHELLRAECARDR